MIKIEIQINEMLKNFKFDIFQFDDTNKITLNRTKNHTYISIPFVANSHLDKIEKHQLNSLLNAIYEQIKSIKKLKIFGIQTNINNTISVEFFY